MRVGLSEGAVRRPAPLLRPYVRSYQGYRLSGFDAGEHVGLPSDSITVILPFDRPLRVVRPAVADQAPGEFAALASGLGTAPVVMGHDGAEHGIQISFTPAGTRAVLGVPPAALGQWMVPLVDLLGSDAAEDTAECESPRLADVAARCGFYDQAHLAREWRALAGSAPSVWRRDEKFAFG
ncbi:hypothetical protein HQ604_00785 [Rhodococcus corynebacterioides]|uniref:HTH araC/xylS-type domain-containing protein n=1 Tax=Rhodococcoides corynebacterioides TaxID=53972 RepID=A0ABS7NZW7_9NOCA|nr:hypothetical protein [Rhodococcus corynebacterioides]MBY6406434.1 hypothetical protein [Rhodococcus corynebacterioides]